MTLVTEYPSRIDFKERPPMYLTDPYFRASKFELEIEENLKRCDPQFFPLVFQLHQLNLMNHKVDWYEYSVSDLWMVPGKKRNKDKEQQNFDLSFYQFFHWVIQKLEENGVPYQIKTIEISHQVPLPNDPRDFIEKSILVEFQGQTWNPVMGFMYRETLTSLYSFKDVSASSREALKVKEQTIDMEDVRCILGLDSVEDEVLSAPTETLAHLEYIWDLNSNPDSDTSLQVLSHAGKDLNYSVPVYLKDSGSEAVDPKEIPRLSQDELATSSFDDFPRKRGVGCLDFLDFILFDKESFEEDMKSPSLETTNILAWREEFQKSWLKLVSLDKEEGSPLYFMHSHSAKNILPAVAELRLDLEDSNVLSALYQWLSIKNTLPHLISNDRTKKIIGGELVIDHILTMVPLVPHLPSAMTPNLAHAFKNNLPIDFVFFLNDQSDKVFQDYLKKLELQKGLQERLIPSQKQKSDLGFRF